MKYYITADIHGFYTEFHKALDEAGYFTDPEPHKLIILGDIFDRGQEAVEMQRFILSLLEQDILCYRQIIPAMVDYYETAHYVFVHGWIPCIQERDGSYSHRSDWREATPEEWRRARWCNGMDAAQACTEEKTILCGHWHCSYGHARYENKGSEFGPDADFSPYYGPGVIALDACTAYSGKINILTLED